MGCGVRGGNRLDTDTAQPELSLSCSGWSPACLVWCNCNNIGVDSKPCLAFSSFALWLTTIPPYPPHPRAGKGFRLYLLNLCSFSGCNPGHCVKVDAILMENYSKVINRIETSKKNHSRGVLDYDIPDKQITYLLFIKYCILLGIVSKPFLIKY